MVIMSNTEPIGTLEEQALKRKERLKNFKNKNANEEASLETTNKMQLPK